MNFFYFLSLLLMVYLVGSIPFGFLIAQCKGLDIRQHGSKNIGATNVGRVLGKPFGLLVFALDALKGFLSVLVVGWLLKQGSQELDAFDYALWLVVAFVSTLGHIFPVYLKFRGGKGVATALGATLGIYPYLTFPTLACFLIWAIVILVTRYVSLASVVAAAMFPVAVFISLKPFYWPQHWPIVVYALALPLLVILRHRSNVLRLLRGTENRIGTSTPQQSTINQESLIK